MPSPLDAAHAALTAAPDDAGARLRWYGRLADTELILVLDHEGPPEALTPRVFALEDGPVVLAFDGEHRLASALGSAVPYAALPGRMIVAALVGQGTGLGVNLGAEAPFLMDASAVDWLAATLAQAPQTRPLSEAGIGPAPDLPPVLLAELLVRLAAAEGPATAAWLVAAGGRPTVVFAGTAAGSALARMVAEAAAFAGTGVTLDAAVLPPGVALPEAVARHGRPLPLARPAAPEEPAPPRPAGPPRLR